MLDASRRLRNDPYHQRTEEGRGKKKGGAGTKGFKNRTRNQRPGTAGGTEGKYPTRKTMGEFLGVPNHGPDKEKKSAKKEGRI